MPVGTLNKKKENESAVLSAIKLWLSEHDYSPSFRDLAAMTGISLGTVHASCHALRDSGTIQFADNIARSIRVASKRRM